MPATPSRKRRSIVLGVILTIGIVGVIGLVTLIGGRVTGIEFSPTHFTSRTFNFYEIPLVQLQVSPIERTDLPIPVTNLLRSQNHITFPSGDVEQWQLVEIRRGGGSKTLGDAEILTSHMRLGEGGATAGSIWEQWSRDNPPAAAVFWPIIKRLAERDLFLLMPELFSIAQRETDAEKLQMAIDQHLRQSYLQLALDLFEAEKLTHAANVLDDALTDYPDDKKL
jgi:hypothetical protein